MTRLARVVVPGCPHHVTQRGNRRQETFFGNNDYRTYTPVGARQTLRADELRGGDSVRSAVVGPFYSPISTFAIPPGVGLKLWIFTVTEGVLR